MLTVPCDGPFVGLYHFLKEHAQNESNPNRIESMQPVFREVMAEKNAETQNIDDFLISEAIMYIRQFVKEGKGGYEYDEPRIDTLCKLFNVQADGYGQKVTALTAVAKQKPQFFLKEAKASEQTLVIEVSHMVKLGVIEFAGTAVVLKSKGTKLKELGDGVKNNEKEKIEATAAWLGTQVAEKEYELLKAELAAAKAENASKN